MSEANQKQARLESLFLSSLDQYIRLKNSIFKNLNGYLDKQFSQAPERLYYDRSFFKREKNKKHDSSSSMSEASEYGRQIKQEQHNRNILKHKEVLNKMFEYSVEFFEFHKNKVRTYKRRLHNVKLRYDWIQKQESKIKDKEERERIEAFKEKKFDIYADLIKKAKKARIIEVLEETDNFLRELASKVLSIKKKANPELHIETEIIEWLNHKPTVEDYDVNKSSIISDNYTKFYYNMTHTNVEQVTEQPTLLEGTLKSYQMQGLQWLVSLYNNKLNGILADEMGLGKTIQTIALLCYIMEIKQNYGPFLIVVPLTTLSNWVMEFTKWAPSIKKVVYKGNPAHRKQLSHLLKTTKWNVCLTTYEYILKDKSDLNRFQWQYIIVDEGHKMKNPKSKFAETLGQLYNSEYRLLLTGTPLQNNLPELWSLLNFLLPEVFHSCDDFEKWFKMPLKKYGNDKESELSEENKLLIIHRFHQVLRPFLLRRVKKDVESVLPNKIEFIIKVELSAWQKIVYHQIHEKQSTSIDPSLGSLGKKTLMNMMMQKRKICDHPYLFLDYAWEVNEEIVRSSGKFELLDRIIPKLITAGHRILVFTQMTRLMDIFESFFSYRGTPH